MQVTLQSLAKTSTQSIQRTSVLSSPNIQLTGHSSQVNACRFDPLGNYIASASFDQTIRKSILTILVLWNVYGEICASWQILQGHTNAVTDINWSADGKFIASSSADKSVGWWDVFTGERLQKWKHADVVNSIAVLRNDTIASVSDDGTIRLWNRNEKNFVKLFDYKVPVTAVEWSNDGNILFTGSLDNTICAWDVRNCSILYRMEGCADTITGLRKSPDGLRLLSNSMDSSLRIWDMKPFCDGIRLLNSYSGALHGSDRNLLKCCWNASGEYIASGSCDRSVVVWNVLTGSIEYKLPGHKGTVNDVDWSFAENIIVTCSSDKTLYLGELHP